MRPLPLVLKKIKSPFLASVGVTLIPILDISLEDLGSLISKALNVEHIKPEQSKPALVVPPDLYRIPKLSDALAIKSSAME